VVCEDLGAEDRGTVVQRDTYFETAQGRLKLREEAGADAHLIAYERPNLRGQKESQYRIVRLDDPCELREALSVVLGISVVVSKMRRLFVLNGIRIHIDRVDDLGDFIEFEGVASSDGDPDRFVPLLADLRQSFGIREDDLLRGSYSDLLLAAACS
jgi:predicted adenylyl cyclase CyaB